MEAQLFAVRAGRMDFNRFARATSDDWTRLAGKLMQKWPLPPAITVDDVRQELLIACWQALPRWEAERGYSLKSFCVFRAMEAAKAWLNEQRSAYKRRDSSPSRHAIACGAVGLETVPEVPEPTEQPRQYRAIELREAISAAVSRCRTVRHRHCVAAIVEHAGDVDAAAAELWGQEVTRRECRLASLAQARRVVWRTAAAVAA